MKVSPTFSQSSQSLACIPTGPACSSHILDVPWVGQWADSSMANKLDVPAYGGNRCGEAAMEMWMEYYHEATHLNNADDSILRLDMMASLVGKKGDYTTVPDLQQFPTFDIQNKMSRPARVPTQINLSRSTSVERLLTLLEENKPVIVLVNYADLHVPRPDLGNGSNQGHHFVIVTGYSLAGNSVAGFYINDPLWPQSNPKGERLYIDSAVLRDAILYDTPAQY